MDNLSQFLSGLPIPSGFRLKFDWNDTGPKGDSTINIIYEQYGEIHQITRNQIFATDEPGSYSLFINLNECKLLNISVEQSDNCDRDRNHYVTCSLIKQQGRGGEQQLNRLFHAPLRGNNIVNWPFFLDNPNIHKYGVPHLFHVEPNVVDYYFDIPDGYSFVPICFRCVLDLDVNVGNRQFRYLFYNGITPFYIIYLDSVLLAGTVYNIYGYESNHMEPFEIDSLRYIKFPRLRLSDDARIRFLISDSLGNDAITDIYIFGYLDLNII